MYHSGAFTYNDGSNIGGTARSGIWSIGYLFLFRWFICYSGMYWVKRNISPQSLAARLEHSHLLEFLIELTPTFVKSFATFQRREDVDHPNCYGLKTGLIKGEWNLKDFQTPECAPRK